MSRWRRLLGRESRYLLGQYLLLLGLLSLLRLAFFASHIGAVQGLELPTLGRGLLLGLRFDLAVTSYLLLPAFLLLLWTQGVKPPWFDPAMLLTVALLLLAGLVQLVDGFPLSPALQRNIYPVAALTPGACSVGQAALLGAILWLFFCLGHLWLGRRWLGPARAGSQEQEPDRHLRIMGATLLLALMLVAARGGLSHKPLAWADASFSDQAFANLLPLNGVCCLGHALFFPGADAGKKSPSRRTL